MESYNEKVTGSMVNNTKLRDYLNYNAIYPIGKDSLGLRVG